MKNCKILATFIITTFLVNYMAVPILALGEDYEKNLTTEQEIKQEDIKESDKDNTNIIQENEEQKEEENNNEIDNNEISENETDTNTLNSENTDKEQVVEQQSSGEPYLEETEVNLYVVNTKFLEEFPELAIPSSYNTEYKIEVKGTDTPVSQMSFYIKDLNR